MTAVRIPAVSPREAHDLASSGRAVIVDVRTPEEWEEARIPGAVLIPMDEIEERHAEIPRDRVVVMQCRSGRRSAITTEQLLGKGFKDVVNLAGGILAWASAGLPVEGPGV